jgi:homoserine O-acetyltransferase
MVDARLAAPFPADANNFVYAWESSAGYNPTNLLERITAPLLLINAADDERNPPETGVTDAAMKRIAKGRLFLIPASEETRGHATTGMAKFYAQELAAFLETTPRRPQTSN